MSTELKESSGQDEGYPSRKLYESLRRTGADKRLARRIADEISERMTPGLSTQRIHEWVVEHLEREAPALAPRYRLARALAALGPQGHLFEKGDAIRYAECVGLRHRGWDYPPGEGLREVVDRVRVHPVTCLASLTRPALDHLLSEGRVLEQVAALRDEDRGPK